MTPTPRRATALTLLLVLLARPARAASLEQDLLAQAPRLITHLQDRGCKNVGVLKFLVYKGDSALTDNAGPLNLGLAQRLEIALALANPVEEAKQIGVIRNASARAAALPGANHLTAAGRKLLFGAEYSLAWGDRKVTADAFLTGTARFSADLRKLTVQIQSFDRSGAEPVEVTKLIADADVGNLTDGGESYLLRDPKSQDKLELTKAQQAAARVKAHKDTFPLLDEAAPVALEVLYDGKEAPLKVKGGRAEVAEPTEGQKVEFVIRRHGGGKERLAVVLKVNGENTLFKQKMPDLHCAKWVLEPGKEKLVVRGFFLDVKQQAAFRVLSAKESKAKEINYGADVGTLSLTVFRERGGKQVAEAPDEDEVEVAAVTRMFTPPKSPKNPFALKAQLKSEADRGLRGLVGEGQLTPGSLRPVPFVCDPVPVMTATVHYYRP
jgi:hypothetical protein